MKFYYLVSANTTKHILQGKTKIKVNKISINQPEKVEVASSPFGFASAIASFFEDSSSVPSPSTSRSKSEEEDRFEASLLPWSSSFYHFFIL